MYKSQKATLQTEIKNQDAIVRKSVPDPAVIDKLEKQFTALNNGETVKLSVT